MAKRDERVVLDLSGDYCGTIGRLLADEGLDDRMRTIAALGGDRRRDQTLAAATWEPHDWSAFE